MANYKKLTHFLAPKKTPVTLNELEGLLCVKLPDWGDKDWLEDRLTEAFEVGEIWHRTEVQDDGKEVLFLIFSEAKDRSVIHAILDQIAWRRAEPAIAQCR